MSSFGPPSARGRFVDAARDHGLASEEGNAVAANAAYERVQMALKEIRAEEDRGAKFLRESAWQAADPSVRAWSAVCLLPLDEELALATLNKLVEQKIRSVSFDAKVAITEWKAGRLKVD